MRSPWAYLECWASDTNQFSTVRAKIDVGAHRFYF